jgi:hypothetical protein
MITLTDGQKVEYHASFNFPKHVYMKIKTKDKETMRREPQQHNEQKRHKSEIQELRSKI